MTRLGGQYYCKNYDGKIIFGICSCFNLEYLMSYLRSLHNTAPIYLYLMQCCTQMYSMNNPKLCILFYAILS